MAISALDRAMGMVNGQNSLDQGGLQEVGQQPGKMLADMKKLLEKLEGSNGAQGGGGAQGSSGAQGSGDSSGSGGSGDQLDMEKLKKMMAGRQGMEAMMPDSDNGRKIGG
ncbi:MAG: hypothetical protein LKM38_14830 [Pseudomonas veronii]|nr:hypothetical protein [Pseudomonas veronii]